MEVTSGCRSTGLRIQQRAFVGQVVPDSAADKAGLEAGDVIVSINGKKINTFMSYVQKLQLLELARLLL